MLCNLGYKYLIYYFVKIIVMYDIMWMFHVRAHNIPHQKCMHWYHYLEYNNWGKYVKTNKISEIWRKPSKLSSLLPDSTNSLLELTSTETPLTLWGPPDVTRLPSPSLKSPASQGGNNGFSHAWWWNSKTETKTAWHAQVHIQHPC